MMNMTSYNYNRPRFGRFLNDFDELYYGNQNITKNYRLKEKENHYLASLDIPGVKASDVDISVEDSVLKVTASRSDDDTSYSYTSSFLLPKDAHSDNIKAMCENGVLKVAIPKSEEVKPKKILLNEGDSDGFFKNLFSTDEKKEIDVDKH